MIPIDPVTAIVGEKATRSTYDRVFKELNLDRPIYEQLALPKEKRSIKLTQMLRDEAVVVWKKYQAKPDKVQY